MLEYMHVKNLALIKDCEISFEKGLNILTGETGAGKSVLLGSVNLALGSKAEKEVIRTGEEEAYVELVFSMNDAAKRLLSEMDIEAEDSVIISRKITSQKSIYKINGESVPAKQVKELAGGLIDIHGQHEHQSLLNNSKQRDMIDAFGGDIISAALDYVKEKYDSYSSLRRELTEAESISDGREREISLLKYECNEIAEANLVIGEDEELEENYRRMQSAGKLLSLVNEAGALISSGTEQDAGGLISRAISNMKKASSYDEKAEQLTEKLLEAESILGDFSLELSDYADTLEFSDEEFANTEERLNEINALKAKFGATIRQIQEYYSEKTERLEKLEHLDEYLLKLKNDTREALEAYNNAAFELSSLRKKASEEFSVLLKSELLSLNFTEAEFSVEFASDANMVSPKGMDSVEFMISTNPGEPVKPIRNVSSGGELSRIMLAIKTILAKKDEVDALIFDEIDAGISGKTAWEVSGRLSDLSTKHQVILITHLAQIAAAADTHFEIVKTSDGCSTTTNIYRLDYEGEISELSRLLGTSENDEATVSNAKELKKKATDRKRH